MNPTQLISSLTYELYPSDDQFLGHRTFARRINPDDIVAFVEVTQIHLEILAVNLIHLEGLHAHTFVVEDVYVHLLSNETFQVHAGKAVGWVRENAEIFHSLKAYQFNFRVADATICLEQLDAVEVVASSWLQIIVIVNIRFRIFFRNLEGEFLEIVAISRTLYDILVHLVIPVVRPHQLRVFEVFVDIKVEAFAA